jgi:hypothetical protein
MREQTEHEVELRKERKVKKKTQARRRVAVNFEITLDVPSASNNV